MPSIKHLPDIAKTQINSANHPLNWVGMEDIAVPINLQTHENQIQTLQAKANLYVSLDSKDEKGIHMSRLHHLLNDLAAGVCDKARFEELLQLMVASQKGISQSAKLDLMFDLLLPKKSLLSDQLGFQTYPISIEGERVKGALECRLKLTVPYSSTCPCSAALSRQLLAQAIDQEFESNQIDKDALIQWVQGNSIATPHSQRSYAYLELTLSDSNWPILSTIINQIEETLATSVQTMVKRTDEQEFARLNAENLMFCEDAARKIKSLLEQLSWVKDYWFKVEHQESLHAHNAVVIDRKY